MVVGIVPVKGAIGRGGFGAVNPRSQVKAVETVGWVGMRGGVGGGQESGGKVVGDDRSLDHGSRFGQAGDAGDHGDADSSFVEGALLVA